MTPPEELTEEAAISELLGMTPEQFTGRRNDIVKAFKRAGKKEQAARLGLVRKPAVHVWAANHLARHRALAVTRLLSTAADLSDAQAKAFSGGSGAGERLRRDSGAYRRALDLAVREAAGLLREAGRPSADETLRRLRDVLGGAALGGPELRHRLGAGTLREEPPSPGAGAFSFAGRLPPRVAAPGRGRAATPGLAGVRPAAPAAATPTQRDKEEHRRLLEARKAAESTGEAASRLSQVARRARRRADAAAAEAASAEREAADAEARAVAATSDAESAAAMLRALTDRR